MGGRRLPDAWLEMLEMTEETALAMLEMALLGPVVVVVVETGVVEVVEHRAYGSPEYT